MEDDYEEVGSNQSEEKSEDHSQRKYKTNPHNSFGDMH